MRLAFLGTPDAAATTLRALVAAGHDVPLVVTRVDKRRGRNQVPGPTPAKAAAVELGIPVSQRVEDVLEVGADLGVVVAFGRIIKADILAQLSMVNVHFSLLPRWRGAAPVERAILAGDARTGVCLMEIDDGLDTGPVYRCEAVEIGSEETSGQLRTRLSTLGAELLVSALASGLGPSRPQEGEATYAEKLGPADLHLDWAQPAADLHRVVRLERAWTTWRGRRLLVLDAALDAGEDGEPPGRLEGDRVMAGSGTLRLVRVQPEGKAPMAARDWLRGARPAPDERLGS